MSDETSAALDAFLAAYRKDWIKAGPPSPSVTISLVIEVTRLRTTNTALAAERDAAIARAEAAELRAAEAVVATNKAHRERMQSEGLTVAMEAERNAIAAQLEQAREALRKIAGISNECTWHAHTRKLAAELQAIIRVTLAAIDKKEPGR